MCCGLLLLVVGGVWCCCVLLVLLVAVVVCCCSFVAVFVRRCLLLLLMLFVARVCVLFGKCVVVRLMMSFNVVGVGGVVWLFLVFVFWVLFVALVSLVVCAGVVVGSVSLSSGVCCRCYIIAGYRMLLWLNMGCCLRFEVVCCCVCCVLLCDVAGVAVWYCLCWCVLFVSAVASWLYLRVVLGCS